MTNVWKTIETLGPIRAEYQWKMLQKLKNIFFLIDAGKLRGLARRIYLDCDLYQNIIYRFQSS